MLSQYLLGLVAVSKNMGMWILRDHTLDNYRDGGVGVSKHFLSCGKSLISTFQRKIFGLIGISVFQIRVHCRLLEGFLELRKWKASFIEQNPIGTLSEWKKQIWARSGKLDRRGSKLQGYLQNRCETKRHKWRHKTSKNDM